MFQASRHSNSGRRAFELFRILALWFFHLFSLAAVKFRKKKKKKKKKKTAKEVKRSKVLLNFNSQFQVIYHYIDECSIEQACHIKKIEQRLKEEDTGSKNLRSFSPVWFCCEYYLSLEHPSAYLMFGLDTLTIGTYWNYWKSVLHRQMLNYHFVHVMIKCWNMSEPKSAQWTVKIGPGWWQELKS